MTKQLCTLLFTMLVLANVSRAEEQPDKLSQFTQRYCVSCHQGDEPEGGIDFESLDFALDDQETTRRWLLALDRVANHEMPPPEDEQPGQPDRDRFEKLLGEAIIAAESRRSDVVLRRLNKHEYQNTVRDLFNVDVIVHGLPDDTSTDGFDTVGEGLAVSAEAMAAYLDAADQVIDAVFGPAKRPPYIHHKTNLLDQVDWKGRPMDQQIGKMFRRTDDGIVVFQSGYCPTHLVNFSRLRAPAGTYRAKFKVRAVQSDEPVTMRVYGGDTIVNRREQHLVGYFDVPPDEWTTVELTDRLLESGGTFHPKCYATRDTRKDADNWPHPGIEIGDIEIEGPLEEWPPASRIQLLGELDMDSAVAADARSILERLLPRAFRSEIAAEEIESYTQIVASAINEGRPFEDALRIVLKTILCSPEFLFLNEPGEDQINDHALASRLSYFLWSSMPDTELTDLASSGRLSQPRVLAEQVDRMLHSPRSQRFTKNFTGQWLDLREINFTEPDANLYPEFDELLRISMVQETELFFEEVLKRNLSVIHFVDSDFTFLNERLAKHYGIEGVVGQDFRRVTLPAGSPRGGLLTQASILKVTANGTYTSPVLRGVWILENILGSPTSPPPDNVGAIEPDIRGATTIREQLAQHRSVQSCSACHRKIDPAGFALECFDPIGGHRSDYRTMAETGKHSGLKQAPFTFQWVRYRIGQPVDATGTMPDGTPIRNIQDFRRILASNPDQLTRNLAEKLMTYAVGRKLGFRDRPMINQIVKQVREQGFGFRDLVHSVVLSPGFQEP